MYRQANWGDKVGVIDSQGEARIGLIVGFDESNELNTKVLYEDGTFDWYNRDILEASKQQ